MKTIYLIYPKKIGTIAPEIYGHFTEHIGGVIYDGLWVGKDSSIPNINGFRKELIEKLKAINPPVIRWPGGCFAEGYDWRDGIGENRPTRPYWWTPDDGRYESNEVGTHEFMELCEMTGAKAYFAANLTSVSPLHIRNWMDYCLSPKGTTTLAKEREKNGHPEPFEIPYWGVGNENWGDGGNMRPETYADEFRRYVSVMNNIDSKVDFFACGSNSFEYEWTHGVVPILASSLKYVNGYSMHYYCCFEGSCGDAVDFTVDEWDKLMVRANRMEEIIERNWNIICSHAMQEYCKLVVDEWGCWHAKRAKLGANKHLLEQQSTMRDAMVTAITLNIFNRHCDKVKMANVAQLVNNLHALFLAEGEHCITTPTYHVFDMYKGHQGAEAIDVCVSENDDVATSLSVSASCKDGKTLVTIGNLSATEDAVISLNGTGMELPSKGVMCLLAHEDIHAHNTFENPDTVVPTMKEFNPRKSIVIPKAGIVTLQF